MRLILVRSSTTAVWNYTTRPPEGFANVEKLVWNPFSKSQYLARICENPQRPKTLATSSQETPASQPLLCSSFAASFRSCTEDSPTRNLWWCRCRPQTLRWRRTCLHSLLLYSTAVFSTHLNASTFRNRPYWRFAAMLAAALAESGVHDWAHHPSPPDSSEPDHLGAGATMGSGLLPTALWGTVSGGSPP